MATEGVFQTLQRIATTLHRLDELTENVRNLGNSMTMRLERVESQMADMRERLARLEACREADRAQIQADLSRFKTEVERAELRLTKQLPGSTEPSN